MRVLLMDTESTSLTAIMGRLLCASFGWVTVNGKGQMKTGPVWSVWDGGLDDHALVVEIRDILEEADCIVGWNCVAPETRVLTSDLRWVSAESLVVGDGLVGFERGADPYAPRYLQRPGQRRQFMQSYVTETTFKILDRVRVTLSDGTEVITTPNHPWLVWKPVNPTRLVTNGIMWKQSQNLTVGTRMFKYFHPWDTDNSHAAGYISAMLDGEGHIPVDVNQITVAQNEGPVWDRIQRVFADYGIQYKTQVVRQGDIKQMRLIMQGGRIEHLEMLGRVRPAKLELIDFDRLGSLQFNGNDSGRMVSVVDVEPIGAGPIIVLGTSSSTYFAEGFGMANSKLHDAPLINARLAKWGERQSRLNLHIDLMYYAAGVSMKIGSRKLDNVAKYFKLPEQKTVLDWDIWARASANDSDAMRQVVAHCEADVRVLGAAYKHLIPYVRTVHR